MSKIAHTARDMIAGMKPDLRPESYVFVTTQNHEAAATLAPTAIATFREAEGISMILECSEARAADFEIESPMRCITLNVFSSLEGVGLTASVATQLADAGIACNMVAAYHHDHAFVPEAFALRALEILTTLESETKQ